MADSVTLYHAIHPRGDHGEYPPSTIYFINSNGVSWGQSVVSDSISITASAAGGTGGGGIAVADSASTLSTNTLVFADSNGISWGLNGSTMTATVQTNWQSSGNYLTTAMLSNRGSDFIQATAGFNGTNCSGTVASNSVSISVGNYITTAMASNRGTDFVQAAAAFVGTSASGTIASGGLSVSIGPYITTAMLSNAATLSNIRVSGGTTSNLLSALTFADSNGISWGLNASTLTATVKTDYQSSGAYLTTAMASNASTQFVQANAGFNGTNASGTIASNAISISVAAPGGGAGATLSYYQRDAAMVSSQTQTVAQSTSVVFPFAVPQNYSFSYLRFLLSGSAVSTTYARSANATAYSGSLFSTIYAVVYSQGTGASSRSLTSVASGSGGFSQQWSFSQNGTDTNSSITQSISYRVSFPPIEGSGVSTFSESTTTAGLSVTLGTPRLSAWTNMLYLDLPFANSLAPNAYWMAIGNSSTSSTQGTNAITGLKLTFSTWGDAQPNAVFRLMGQAANASNQMELAIGSLSTNAIGTLAGFGLSNVSSSASHVMPFFVGIRHA